MEQNLIYKNSSMPENSYVFIHCKSECVLLDASMCRVVQFDARFLTVYNPINEHFMAISIPKDGVSVIRIWSGPDDSEFVKFLKNEGVLHLYTIIDETITEKYKSIFDKETEKISSYLKRNTINDVISKYYVDSKKE